jgi:hypothetical protein
LGADARAGPGAVQSPEKAKERDMTIRLAALIGVGVASSLASGGIFYDEQVDGDLSSDRFNPTVFDLNTGTNTFIMDVVDSDLPEGDRDYFTVTVGAGQTITELFLTESFNPGGGFDAVAFIAMQIGPVVTVDPAAPDPSPLAGFIIGTPDLVGTDVLGLLAGDAGPTLGEGEYAFWVQQTGESLTRVRMDFTVVPAPGAAALLGLGGLVALRRRR